jgi:xylulokinase
MTGATGPGDLVIGVMEGVAFSARMALEAVETSGAQTVQRLRYGGGGARSDAWSRIRATALGRSLDRVASSDVGAVGATVMAGAASGAMGNLSDATAALVSLDRSFDPDPKEAARIEERYAAFCELYRALGKVNDLINPVSDDG